MFLPGVIGAYCREAKMARPRWIPTAKERDQVKMMAAYGITQPAIAAVIGISERTLRTRCKIELATGLTSAISNVAGALYKSALGGNVEAQKFFLRCCGRWVDPIHIEQLRPVAEMSDEEVAARLAIERQSNDPKVVRLFRERGHG
jgi:DNA-binding transcriptional regulator YiaG